MYTLFVFISLIFGATCQFTSPSVVQAVNDLFNASLYEEVTQEPLRSFGALRKCGENEREGLDVCVPYYNCDPTTRTVIQDGATDGFNVMDIRYGDDNQCDHYLDVCCQISQENVTSTRTEDSSTQSSVTQSRVTQSSVEQSSVTQSVSPSINTERNTSPSTTSTGSTERTTPENEVNSQENEIVPSNGGNWSTCGIRYPNGIDFKISGYDREAQYGEFPWQVALLRIRPNENLQCLCGGSLIRPNVILTASHCVHSLKASEITVRAGEWDTQTTKERIPHQDRLASRIIVHENYGSTGSAHNDIALVVLERPFAKVKSVGTICLPDQDQYVNSKHCFASGWGKSNFGRVGAYSVILKKIELPMVRSSDCQRLLRKTRLGPRFQLHRSFTCAGGEAGRDTCTGDGGSPLVCPDPNHPERYIETGIVSWGVGCGVEGVPGVYTDVAKFRRWIDEKLREINA